MHKDNLGDRMKLYERNSSTKLITRMPVIGRLDGRSFSKLTKDMKRPYDERFQRCMWAAAKAICEELAGCRIAYVQSDEITVLLTDWETYNTACWFGYRVQKMTSVAASIATSAFMKEHFKEFGNIRSVAFDARFWNLPKHEVTNCFLWRQQDATRNSIQMMGQSVFTHKELHKKSCDDIQEMLHSKFSINWNDTLVPQKRGVCLVRQVNDAGRSSWNVDKNIPIFSKDRDYIEQHLKDIFWKNDE
jgi:tRNA(His) 5'-end guanylyltransferase